jgi:hypothetical protein
MPSKILGCGALRILMLTQSQQSAHFSSASLCGQGTLRRLAQVATVPRECAGRLPSRLAEGAKEVPGPRRLGGRSFAQAEQSLTRDPEVSCVPGRICKAAQTTNGAVSEAGIDSALARFIHDESEISFRE